MKEKKKWISAGISGWIRMVGVHPCQHLVMHSHTSQVATLAGVGAGHPWGTQLEPAIRSRIKGLLSACTSLPRNTCKSHLWNNFIQKIKTSVKSVHKHTRMFKSLFLPTPFSDSFKLFNSWTYRDLVLCVCAKYTQASFQMFPKSLKAINASKKNHSAQMAPTPLWCIYFKDPG